MDTISNFLCVEKMGWSDAYQPIVFRDFVNQRQFGAFLFYLFRDKAK